jgi:ATP adenylyltransferase/5',5'''-P-1,P-4-tetraphosphate phosphorylase II
MFSNKKIHISGTEKPVDSDNPILAYHSQQFAFDWAKIELLLKNVPMISEQTLVFQSNFSQQTPNYMTH